MRWLVYILVFPILILSAKPAVSQQSDDDGLDRIIESIVEDQDLESFEFESVVDHLSEVAKRPIDLNKTSREELTELYLFSEAQINSLFNHILINGKLISIYELQAIPNWDLSTIHRVLPFVTINKDLDDYHMPMGEQLTKGNYQFFIRYQQILEEQAGYIPADSGSTAQRYVGSQPKLYARFRYNFGNRISYGITAEKDQGEEFFKGSQSQGFDFYSAHASIAKVGPFKQIIVGDFEAKLGQGLIQWSGFGFGKSPFVLNVKKEGKKLKPYTSVNEIKFYRGLATTVGDDNWEATLFASHKKIDGNVIETDTTLDEIEAVSSFQESGFHRLPSEIADKGSVQQTVFGGNVSYNKRKWHLGINAVHFSFDTELQRNARAYNQFDFQGSSLGNLSLDYHYIHKNAHFFGESAISDNGGIGALNGVIASLHSSVNVSIVHRYFEKDFQTLSQNAFAESKGQNEHGLYIGAQISPVRQWTLNVYADNWRHPWLRSSSDFPTQGSEYLAQLTYRPSRRFQVYGRLKYEQKQINLPSNEGVFDEVAIQERGTARLHLSYKANDDFTLKSRAEVSYANNEVNEEFGYLVYQDLNFKKKSFPLSFNLRYALFETPSYNSRIYAYESDVLYSFSIPAYYNRGSRAYINFRYKLNRHVDFWFKIAQTYWSDESTFGSGLEEIEGPARTEIKVQTRLRW